MTGRESRELALEAAGTTTARDIMQSRVVTVGPDDPLLSVHRLFADEEISGAPVVNQRGEVEGVVTIRDLLRERRHEQEMADHDLAFYREDIVNVDLPDWCVAESVFVDRLTSKRAADVMTRDVISVEPDAIVSEVVERVMVNRIHRVLVLEPGEAEGTLVGIISLFDLVGLLA